MNALVEFTFMHPFADLKTEKYQVFFLLLQLQVVIERIHKLL